MATNEYRRWVAAGSRYQIAQPILEIAEVARFRGMQILGILGDASHLQADFPEDHTPFSFTPYPIALPGYWVTAIDLANVKGWGDAILRDARIGLVPWLKYMNYDYVHWDSSDGFRQGRGSGDEHIHLSCFSNYLHASIGDYDPSFAGKRPEVEGMYGPLLKGGHTVCVPVPVVATRRRIFSLAADFGKAKIRVAWGRGKNRWQVISVPLDAAGDPWTTDIPLDVVEISLLFQEGDDAAVGWSVLYV